MKIGFKITSFYHVGVKGAKPFERILKYLKLLSPNFRGNFRFHKEHLNKIHISHLEVWKWLTYRCKLRILKKTGTFVVFYPTSHFSFTLGNQISQISWLIPVPSSECTPNRAHWARFTQGIVTPDILYYCASRGKRQQEFLSFIDILASWN